MHATTVAFGEFDLTITQGEQSIVFAATHVVAGMEMCSTLADNDVSGTYYFTAESLYSQTLSVGVTAVTGGTETFLMCHS